MKEEKAMLKSDAFTFWIRVDTHNFMSLGCGPIWKKKLVAAEKCVVVGFNALVGYDSDRKVWCVWEAFSGGLCGWGKTKEGAKQTARRNIKRTPDFKKQIKELGPVSELKEVR